MQKEYILHGPPENISDFADLSVAQLLLNQLTVHGSRVAHVDAHTKREQTYDEILTVSKKLAIYLGNAGLKINDCIALCSENSLEFCIPVCAAFFAGTTICPLNPYYSERELRHALSISKPKYIFVSSVSAGIIQKTVSQLPWPTKLIMLTESADVNLPSINDLISDITANNFQVCNVDVNTHVAAILCSSGTTGLPKGVMLTDKNILTVIRHTTDVTVRFLNKDMVTLGLLPFYHAYSFVILIVRLIIGSKTVVLSRFDEHTFLRTIEKYRIEHLTLVPPLMIFLAKHPLVDKYDLSSLKTIWCGAAVLPKEVQKAVATRLNVSDIKQGYGLTETTLAVLQSPNGSFKYGSVGMLAPGMSAKVIPIDEFQSNKALGPNCIGELCFKGDLIMKGYCNDEQATTATIDKDGWLHTGDVGYYDENGYFYIVDRIKELIKYKASQVPPAELEAILLTCPGIKDAAVVGLPNEEVGELPVAFVIKQDGSNITEQEIIKYVDERVSSPKRLRGGVRFVENIPKTPSGKILRRVLRNMLQSKL